MSGTADGISVSSCGSDLVRQWLASPDTAAIATWFTTSAHTRSGRDGAVSAVAAPLATTPAHLRHQNMSARSWHEDEEEEDEEEDEDEDEDEGEGEGEDDDEGDGGGGRGGRGRREYGRGQRAPGDGGVHCAIRSATLMVPTAAPRAIGASRSATRRARRRSATASGGYGASSTVSSTAVARSSMGLGY